MNQSEYHLFGSPAHRTQSGIFFFLFRQFLLIFEHRTIFIAGVASLLLSAGNGNQCYLPGQ